MLLYLVSLYHMTVVIPIGNDSISDVLSTYCFPLGWIISPCLLLHLPLLPPLDSLQQQSPSAVWG